MPPESTFEPVIGAESRVRSVDGLIADVAERQHGVVSRVQLVRLGLGHRAIGHRLERGRLHAMPRGVDAVGHRAISREGHSRLPRPEVNVLLEAGRRTVEVDCLWRGHGVVVELDGRSTHATIAAFERDRARDRCIQAAGWRAIRVTWRQLHTERRDLTGDLRTLLGTPTPHLSPS